MSLLEVQDLTKYFPVAAGIGFIRARNWVKAVDGISFVIEKGQTLGLVGESGCGKTTTSKLILRLDQPTQGSIRFEGQELQALKGVGLRAYRRAVQAVFQDPFASLNPRMRVGTIIAEPFDPCRDRPKGEVRERVEELLELVGLPRGASELFPHEFSGGQRQRIAIARSLSVNPKLVVLDEPVSALDVSIRAQILNLLRDLQGRFGVGYLFIAHDLAAVAYLSDVVAVMYLGRIVEIGSATAIMARPLHPYTQALFSAALPAHPDERRDEIVVSGEIPSPVAPPAGCRFHTRCPRAMPACSTVEPHLNRADDDRRVACHLYTPEGKH